MKIFNSILILALFFVFGCSLDEPGSTATKLSTGDADFTRYVALGNSLTAGYQSGALTAVHQQYSYPNFIAQQAGSATFEQPLLGYPGIGAFSLSGGGILELQVLDLTSPVILPAFYSNYPDFNREFPYETPEVATYPQPYNNLGIPGAVLVDMISASSAATSASGNNPFFDVILRGSGTSFQQAKALQPTFITCWIGNNDVLGYATSGGTFPPTPTPTDAFGFLYGQLLDSLVATGADIVVANIPDVTAIPFFTSVPYAIDPGIGTAVPLVISTNAGPRQATANDLILLAAQTLIGDVSGAFGPEGVPVGFDISAPLPNGVVLDVDEVTIAQAAVADFNSTIASLAGAKNVTLVDMNAFFNDVAQNGLYIGGLEFTTAFITGGLFSLDGVHASDLGYAIVANKFIDTINKEFNATIPFVNVVDLMSEISPSVNLAKASYQKNAFDNMINMFSGR